jgi:hypothetical protein
MFSLPPAVSNRRRYQRGCLGPDGLSSAKVIARRVVLGFAGQLKIPPRRRRVTLVVLDSNVFGCRMACARPFSRFARIASRESAGRTEKNTENHQVASQLPAAAALIRGSHTRNFLADM